MLMVVMVLVCSVGFAGYLLVMLMVVGGEHGTTAESSVLIRFTNLTNRRVDLIWVDFQGNYQKYYPQHYRGCVEATTFKLYSWIAANSLTKDRLLIDKGFVYTPKGPRKYIQNQNPNIRGSAFPLNPRLLVAITTPMYSLQYRTLLKVRSCLRNDGDVDLLGLPNELNRELKVLVQERNRILNLESV